MAAKPNFHLKAVAKEGGRRENIAGGFSWWEERKDWEKEKMEWKMNKGKESQEENHDEEMKYVKKKCSAGNMWIVIKEFLVGKKVE